MNNKKTIYGIIFILICLVGIGYAAIVSNLTITGTAKIKTNSFDVHFENITVTNGSVEINTGVGDSAPVIEPTNRTRIDYSVTLEEPGDFYEFTVKVVNGGTIDAMVNTVTSMMNNAVINNNLPNYLEYKVVYIDEIPIEPNHELNATQVETYKVKVGYRTDINPGDLPTTPSTLNFSFSANYVQKDSNAITRPVLTFADGSWSQIASAIRSGYTDFLNVGDEKNVPVTGRGTYKVRVANTNTTSECLDSDYSQTACGVVFEFVDVIENHRMNKYDNNANTNGDGNRGGWEYSDMRAYLNNGIYLPNDETNKIDYTSFGLLSKLPEALQNVITPTRVVSGRGSKDTGNFITTDKLYLLSTVEVWGTPQNDTVDTTKTRQLDYYKNLGVTTSDYGVAIKKNISNNSIVWWLRSARSSHNGIFNYVSSNGNGSNNYAVYTYGVSPAFRIG